MQLLPDVYVVGGSLIGLTGIIEGTFSLCTQLYNKREESKDKQKNFVSILSQ